MYCSNIKYQIYKLYMDRINHWIQKCQTERSEAAFPPKQYAGAEGRGTSCGPCVSGRAVSVRGQEHQQVTAQLGWAQAGPSRVAPSCLCVSFNQLLNAWKITKARDKTMFFGKTIEHIQLYVNRACRNGAWSYQLLTNSKWTSEKAEALAGTWHQPGHTAAPDAPLSSLSI